MSSQCGKDIADMLLEKLFFLVDLQKEGADKLEKLATSIEERTRPMKVTRVVGSSVSVAGAAALTAAGVIGVCTGGLALPLLVPAASLATFVGVTTSVTSQVADTVVSTVFMNDAESAADKIENVEKGIQQLLKSLKEEGARQEKRAGDISSEDYVVEKILRAMAKRKKIMINDKFHLHKMIPDSSRKMISEKVMKISVTVILKLVLQAVAKKSGKALAKQTVNKATAKAVGRVAGGAVGLVFSIYDLVDSCKELGCDTNLSHIVREKAKSIRSTSRELKEELEEIQNVCKRLAEVIAAIENTKRSSSQEEILLEFAMENCPDQTVRGWLRHSAKAFVQLVNMFQYLKIKIEEEERNNHSNNIDITFVAHGSISDPFIPACLLLPLPTVTDVVLYSPWNCKLSADAAYDVSTGLMKPEHRVFYSRREKAQNPSGNCHPTNLPKQWNSMKEAGDKKIPVILLSPVKPRGDNAWKRFEFLRNKLAGFIKEKNRIIIPYMVPQEKTSGSADSIPFHIVTLALSLVLVFSRFQATLHLTACLGDTPGRKEIHKEYLKDQYAYADDSTVLDSALSHELQNFKLLNILKHIFV